MGRRKKKVIENLEVLDIASEGKSIAKHEDKIIFIPNVVPGDVVDVIIRRNKPSFSEGEVLKFHKYSEKRIQPVCEYFGVCGGCKWQNLTYEDQLFYKEKQVRDNIERIGKIHSANFHPIFGSKETLFYRNKLEYTFSNKKWLTKEQIDSKDENINRNGVGFHIPKMFDKVIDIDKCYLQNDFSNHLRNHIRDFAFENNLTFFDIREQYGLLRNLIVRTSSNGEIMIIVCFHEEEKIQYELLENVKLKFPEITSLMYVNNTKKNDNISDLDIKTYAGLDHIYEEMEGLKFKIGPKSFYQTNSKQAYELYKFTRDYASLKGEEVVFDLYTGTGTIANFVAKKAKHVVGIEYVEDAITDAKHNSEINNINNTTFYAGDMKDIFKPHLFEKHGYPDTIITDPPRAGMHADVIDLINKSGAKRVVYVSCNPATQARDLKMMEDFYTVTEIQPVDMFPQTHHVENIALLIKKD